MKSLPRYSVVPEPGTVAALIEVLSNFPADARVAAYDCDSDRIESVTGALFVPDSNVVELCTDEP